MWAENENNFQRNQIFCSFFMVFHGLNVNPPSKNKKPNKKCVFFSGTEEVVMFTFVSFQLTVFLPHLKKCCESSIFQLRELAAATWARFAQALGGGSVDPEELLSVGNQNRLHGVLLRVRFFFLLFLIIQSYS